MEYLKDIENQVNLNKSFFKQKLNNFSEDEIKSIIKTIIQKLSMNPLVEQKEIFNNLKLKK